jgi:hypothetical protein
LIGGQVDVMFSARVATCPQVKASEINSQLWMGTRGLSNPNWEQR